MEEKTLDKSKNEIQIDSNEQQDKEKREHKSKIKKIITNLTPLLGLVALFGIYFIVGAVKDINFNAGLSAIVNQSVIVAIIATGAIFIFTLGSFDISLGASTLVGAVAGALTYNVTGNIVLMLIVCVLVAITASLISSVLASIFNLPVFVTTVAMMSVLGAVSEILITMDGGNSVRVDLDAMYQYDTIWIKIIILVVFSALCIFIFDFTKIGRRQKALGGNPTVAKLTGISMKKYAILAFIIAGLGVGLGAFLTVVRTPTLTTSSAGDIGMSIVVAIVFGGMPLSGGAKSKIYAALIGAFSMTVLNQIMTIILAASPAGLGVAQIVRAVFFLGIVFLASFNYRGKMLPR